MEEKWPYLGCVWVAELKKYNVKCEGQNKRNEAEPQGLGPEQLQRITETGKALGGVGLGGRSVVAFNMFALKDH